MCVAVLQRPRRCEAGRAPVGGGRAAWSPVSVPGRDYPAVGLHLWQVSPWGQCPLTRAGVPGGRGPTCPGRPECPVPLARRRPGTDRSHWGCVWASPGVSRPQECGPTAPGRASQRRGPRAPGLGSSLGAGVRYFTLPAPSVPSPLGLEGPSEEPPVLLPWGHVPWVLPGSDGPWRRVPAPSWACRTLRSCPPKQWLPAGLLPSSLGPPRPGARSCPPWGPPGAGGLRASPGHGRFRPAPGGRCSASAPLKSGPKAGAGQGPVSARPPPQVQKRRVSLPRVLSAPPVAGTACHAYDREVHLRCELAPGYYLAVPSTFRKDVPGQFLLRVFSSGSVSLR